jgi:hypothetical protein
MVVPIEEIAVQVYEPFPIVVMNVKRTIRARALACAS